MNVHLRFSTFKAHNSDLLNAPAKPNEIIALSRICLGELSSGIEFSRYRTTSTVAASCFFFAVPYSRLKPLTIFLINRLSVGEVSPCALCAVEIAAKVCSIVEYFRLSFVISTMYAARVSGEIGKVALKPFTSHQVKNRLRREE